MARGPESLALELRCTFLEERAESFLRVRHREQAILQLAFEGKAFVHRHLGPLRHAPSDATRRSVAIAISRPPPTQWPSIAAMKSFGVLSILFSVSWQLRQNIAL